MSMMAQLMLEMRVYSYFMAIGAIIGILVCWFCIARPAIERATGKKRLYAMVKDAEVFAKAIYEVEHNAVKWEELSEETRRDKRTHARDILQKFNIYIK